MNTVYTGETCWVCHKTANVKKDKEAYTCPNCGTYNKLSRFVNHPLHKRPNYGPAKKQIERLK